MPSSDAISRCHLKPCRYHTATLLMLQVNNTHQLSNKGGMEPSFSQLESSLAQASCHAPSGPEHVARLLGICWWQDDDAVLHLPPQRPGRQANSPVGNTEIATATLAAQIVLEQTYIPPTAERVFQPDRSGQPYIGKLNVPAGQPTNYITCLAQRQDRLNLFWTRLDSLAIQ